MKTLNILKSSSGFASILFFILKIMSFISPLGSVFTTTDEEEPRDFCLISSFKTLLLAESIEITPSAEEFDNEVLNVSQESGREPSRSKP